MFDYQAGEKQKLTLIMTGVTGLIMGITLMAFLSPETGSGPKKTRERPKWANNPDVTGKANLPADYNGGQGQAKPENMVQATEAQDMLRQWLGYAFDFNSQTCGKSQERAMQFMTPECASSYRSNVWTTELATQIEQANLKNEFILSKMSAGQNNPDGSIVIFMEGEQTFFPPSAPPEKKHISMEYIVKKTPEGLQIAGFHDGAG
ncbi:MAG: hypothetical protein K2X70_10115 [Candidatus Obscuribacterales bacterium]|jgi:hypothetical protein|nr:hypothetical protein [Candidatus Obscuribacterales bacterium]